MESKNLFEGKINPFAVTTFQIRALKAALTDEQKIIYQTELDRMGKKYLADNPGIPKEDAKQFLDILAK